jgi:N-acetylglucosaminyl-diphospho-decaprenol L-rhamnosyltransferase
MPMRKIIAIVVNYRTPHLACECIESLVKDDSEAHTFVVDNDSGDDSLVILRDYVNSKQLNNRVTVVSSPRNGGFAYGCNYGVKAALSAGVLPKYYLFLNPDAQIKKGVCKILEHAFSELPKYGILGATVLDQHGVVQKTAHSFFTPLTELLDGARLNFLNTLFQKNDTGVPIDTGVRACDWVSGACFAVRPDVADQLELFDEKYFLYFEEVDFCFRAHKIGWKVAQIQDAVAIHREGSSTGITRNVRRPSYWFNSRRRFFLKNYGVISLLAADLLWCLGRMSWRFRKVLGLGKSFDQNDPPHFMRDLVFGDLRRLLFPKASS